MKISTNMPLLINFSGPLCKATRIRKGITLKQLEAITGIFASTISRFENEKQTITLLTAAVILAGIEEAQKTAKSS